MIVFVSVTWDPIGQSITFVFFVVNESGTRRFARAKHVLSYAKGTKFTESSIFAPFVFFAVGESGLRTVIVVRRTAVFVDRYRARVLKRKIR